MSKELDAQLWKAVSDRDIERVESLLNAGADVETTDRDDWTVLMEAVWWNNVEIIKLLLDHGANVDARHKRNGITALMWGVDHGSDKAVKLLLDYGADTETMRDSDGETPLISASCGTCKNRTKIVEILLNNKTNIEARDNEGRTPLMHACSKSYNVDIMKLLLDRGADLFARDFSGKTALNYAKSEETREALKTRALKRVVLDSLPKE